MRSPFHSESEAFRSLLILIAGVAPIALAAALGPTWLVLGAFGVVLGALAARMTHLRIRARHSRELRLKSAPAHIGAPGERRVLVVANETLGEVALLDELERLVSTPGTRVLLLAPALISPGARLTGAIDRPLEQARARLDAALDRIGRDFDLEGETSDADPLEAIEDAFATFGSDEVVVSTRGARHGHGLEPGLAGLVRERFAVPVNHLIVDPGARTRERDASADEELYRRRRTRTRTTVLDALTGLALVAAVALLAVAVIQSAQTTPVVRVVALKVIAGYKLGPDGQKHDVFTTTNFDVKVGTPIKLRIDNTDNQPHSITSPTAGVNIIARPGTHTYTLIVMHRGRFVWYCAFACDSWAMAHPGYMRGFIIAT